MQFQADAATSCSEEATVQRIGAEMTVADVYISKCSVMIHEVHTSDLYPLSTCERLDRPAEPSNDTACDG